MESSPKNWNLLSRRRTYPASKVKMPPEQRSVSFEGHLIEYTLNRSGRKTIEFAVRPDRRVVVKAPWVIPAESIDQKVLKRGHWILKQLEHFHDYPPPRPPLRYTEGEEHLLLGDLYPLSFQTGTRNRVEISGGLLTITFRGKPDSTTAHRLLERWYREQARDVFSKSLARCWPAFVDDGLPEPTLAIRKMKRCWGSLSRKGVMTLNLELVRASPECIDYVVIHELCHLAHPNHSPRFYRKLAGKLPGWETIRRKLEKDLA